MPALELAKQRLEELSAEVERKSQEMSTLLDRLDETHPDIARPLAASLQAPLSQPLLQPATVVSTLGSATAAAVAASTISAANRVKSPAAATPPASAVTRAAAPAAVAPLLASSFPAPPAELASRNPILYMDESTLRSTPLDKLMDMYGPKGAHQFTNGGSGRRLLRRPSGGSGCDYDFGVTLSDRWRDAAKECCAPIPAQSKTGPASNGTKLTCHFIQQTKHHGAGDQLLLGENVQLSFKDLVDRDGAIPKAYFTRYVQTKHNQGHSKIKWSKGSMSGTCRPDPSAGWKKSNFPGWNVDYFDSFEPLLGADAHAPLQCDVWVNEPTLLVERDTFANFFHNSEDFFNTFLALSILRWPVKDLQILLTDIFPKGPFWPMWSKVFRGPKGVSPEPLTAWDIAQKYGDKRVCFKQLAVAILGAAAPMTVASWDTGCHGVALVRAYADFVVRGLGLQDINQVNSIIF